MAKSCTPRNWNPEDNLTKRPIEGCLVGGELKFSFLAPSHNHLCLYQGECAFNVNGHCVAKYQTYNPLRVNYPTLKNLKC